MGKEETWIYTKDQADGLSKKLLEFYEGLDRGEQVLMQDVLARASKSAGAPTRSFQSIVGRSDISLSAIREATGVTW